jgi:peptidoglycan/LPS O-acetylase OafA/YrhL
MTRTSNNSEAAACLERPPTETGHAHFDDHMTDGRNATSSPAGEQPPTYIASLDGLRALSVLCVIYAHLSITHTFPRYLRASTLGRGGVIIFFVISGFLITSQLREEYVRTGTILLRRFYFRRFMRLMPAMLLLIAVSVVLASFGIVPLTAGDVLHSITYTVNYWQSPVATLGHLWSLSVEEQFYLLWPFALLLFPARATRVAVAAVILCPIFRWFAWRTVSDVMSVSYHFEMVADALALGCLVALTARHLRKVRLMNSSAVVGVSFAVILICCALDRTHPQFEPISYSIEAISAALIVASLSFYRDTVAARALRWPPLVWIGLISYSLYLWQQMFCFPTPGGAPFEFQRFPWNVLLAFAAASISYYAVESPMRRYGRSFKWGPQRQLPDQVDTFVKAL